MVELSLGRVAAEARLGPITAAQAMAEAAQAMEEAAQAIGVGVAGVLEMLVLVVLMAAMLL